MNNVDSLIRWVGGKTRISNRLIQVFPKNYNNYYEPFIGGGSVFLQEIQNCPNKDRKYFISDWNEHLVGVWQSLQSDLSNFTSELSDIKYWYESGDRREKYLGLRSDFNQSTPSVQKWAKFYALTKLSFNGLVRYNSRGGFNSAFGGMPGKIGSLAKEHLVLELDKLRSISNLLNEFEVDISRMDYSESIRRCQEGDFTFMDPPYEPDDSRIIEGVYTGNGFDVVKFIAHCKNLPCDFLICNHDAEILRSSFDGYRFESTDLLKQFTSSSKNRKKTKEVFISTLFPEREQSSFTPCYNA